MKIKIENLPEPRLSFGAGDIGIDPRRALAQSGPADPRPVREVRLALVGPEADVKAVRKWLSHLNHFVAASEGNATRFPHWPGAECALGIRFVIDESFVRPVDPARLEAALAKATTPSGFDDLVELFDGRLQGLFGDHRPDCIIVCLSEFLGDLRVENPRLSPQERRALEILLAEEEEDQLALFQPSPEELKAAEELRTQADDLLFRTFYRALKARINVHSNPVPLQFVRRDTVDRSDARGQSVATRAWNLAVSLYYKSGGLPWRPHDLPEGTCFIGISFHHQKRRSSDLVYASVAQAFATDVEPFALKGALIDKDQKRDRQPYLNEQQASVLMKDVIAQYEDRAGVLPRRIVVHKTSAYQPEEERGFRHAAKDKVPACDLIWIRSTPFRLIRKGTQEPWRGTLCTLGDETYLFTSGYVPWWNEYPGPHIPAPIQIGSAEPTDLRQRALEILSLSKMNWNNSEGISRYPITLSFAKRVGQLMSELSENQIPNPSYRFHM
jgi:hypothetical protein